MTTMTSPYPVHLSVEAPTLPLPPPRKLPPGEYFERSVPHDVETLVSVKVAPASVCRLRVDGVADVLHLDADDRGIVRFHARARPGADAIEVSLDCYDNQRHGVTHRIALRSDVASTPTASSPDLLSEPVVHGTVLSALVGDPMVPSNEELIAAGYPRRPHRDRAPKRFERWLAKVSCPRIHVGPRIVHHPELTHSLGLRDKSANYSTPPGQAPSGVENNASWNAWCGAYADHPKKQFAYVSATWQVPWVSPMGQPFSMMSEWVGLDNSATDLYQAGTGATCIDVNPIIGDLPFGSVLPGWTFASYYMWMESLPWSQWTLPNFPVSPGDTITVEIWVADQYGGTVYRNEPAGTGGLTPADNSVWFYLTSSNGAGYLGTFPTAPKSFEGMKSSGFTGGTAEFILERPSLDNGNGHFVPVPLAFFFPTLMTDCAYDDADYGDSWQEGLLSPTSLPFDGHLTYGNMVNKSTNHVLARPLLVPEPHAKNLYSMLFIWQDWL